ncbi:MAG: hypothetical protein ACI9VR_004194 [Cognaticolwellia sp.]|jgi:hypothetical protein
MSLPVAQALSKAVANRGELLILGPRWAPELYQGLNATFLAPDARPQGTMAVILPPSFSSAWRLRHIPQRFGVSGQGRRLLLTACYEPTPGMHRTETYAAVAALAQIQVSGPPQLDWVLPKGQLPLGHLAIAPLSPSGAPVMWKRFEALGLQSPVPVAVYLGPGETWAPQPDWPRFQERSLVTVAAELRRARALIVNDSGYSHFARALGVPTVVVHGSTLPTRTGAMGSLPVLARERPPCAPCYAKHCEVPGVPCLDISVEQVQAALLAVE